MIKNLYPVKLFIALAAFSLVLTGSSVSDASKKSTGMARGLAKFRVLLDKQARQLQRQERREQQRRQFIPLRYQPLQPKTVQRKKSA